MTKPLQTAAAWATAAVVLAGALIAASAAEGPLMKSAVFQWDGLAVTKTDIGARRTVVRAPTATLDELESHVTTLNPGQSPHPPHQHPNEEMILVKEGRVDAYVNGDWVPVATGGIIFFASNVPHTVRNTGGSAATYYVINWSPPGMLKNRTLTR
jgi:XRE family transcriptional regulator, regulator of sulfur utilization